MATQALPEIEAHYRALREGVALFDRSARGKLDVRGPDAAEYLQGQVTNDVAALQPGSGCYAALLNPKGRLLADMRVLRVGDELWLDTEPIGLDALRSNLEMYKIGRDVEVVDTTTDRAILSLIGPRTQELLGIDPPRDEHASTDAVIETIPVLVVTTDVGVDLLFAEGSREDLSSVLAARGALAIGEEAAEILRIEHGRPRYGADMSADNLPAEAGLEERAVSFTKGCYVGQEPVARMHHRGHPNRHLRGLELSAPALTGQEVSIDGKLVGKVSSAALSPRLGPIALALVRREIEPGQEVLVGDSHAPARMIRLPFPSD
jgi:folate-binding protein YgfZ